MNRCRLPCQPVVAAWERTSRRVPGGGTSKCMATSPEQGRAGSRLLGTCVLEGLLEYERAVEALPEIATANGALRADARFEELGLPHSAALAFSAGGDVNKACEILRRIGAVADEQRLDSASKASRFERPERSGARNCRSCRSRNVESIDRYGAVDQRTNRRDAPNFHLRKTSGELADRTCPFGEQARA
jgi:hypothetical protein